MSSALALLMASAFASAGPVHHTQIEHQGNPIAVSYRADTDLTTRQIGMSAGTRRSTERCLWTARVGVVRELSRANNGSISHRLDADKVLSGSRPGSCTLTQHQIAKDLARRDDDVRAHLAAVAVQDRSQALADLEAMQRLAAQ